MNRREVIAGLGGVATGWSLAAWGQQPTLPVVGVLNGQSPDTYRRFVAGIGDGLKEVGYLDGQNVAVEYRWAEAQYDRLPALATDLVNRNVAVIVAGGSAGNLAPFAAKAATKTIPIVFTSADDPVASGLVTQLNRPGGNITGITFFSGELGAKRLELLLELVPKAAVIGLLANPTHRYFELYMKDVQTAAQTLGRKLIVVRSSTANDLDNAFIELTRLSASALVVNPDAFFNAQRTQIVTLAARHKIPSIYEGRDFAVAGGLITYGASITDVYRQAGVYAGKILKGSSPGDLPILRPTKFELVVNLKTAKTLGLDIPPTLLARADEVIE